MNNIISLNIVNENILLNSEQIPLLLAFNNKFDDESIIHFLSSEKKFYQFLEQKEVFSTIENYVNTHIVGIVLEYETKKFKTFDFCIEKIFELTYNESIINNLSNYILDKILKNDSSYMEKFENDYNVLIEMFKSKYSITDMTFINYIRYILGDINTKYQNVNNEILNYITNKYMTNNA